MTPTKVCTQCNQEKSADPETGEFNKDRSKKDGLESRCRKCRSEAKRQYASHHKDRVVTAMRRKPKEITPDRELIAKANFLAMRDLVEKYPFDFKQFVSMHRQSLGVKPEWRAV